MTDADILALAEKHGAFNADDRRGLILWQNMPAGGLIGFARALLGSGVCPDCNGTGIANNTEAMDDCKPCKGTGMTGRTTPDHEAYYYGWHREPWLPNCVCPKCTAFNEQTGQITGKRIGRKKE